MSAATPEQDPFAEGYYRGKWAIYLFEQSQQLLATYRLFPEELHDYAITGEFETLRTQLAERYQEDTLAENLQTLVDGAFEVLVTGSEVQSDIVELQAQRPAMGEGEALLERATRIADSTPLDLIMSAAGWTTESQNS